jgi:hypothetical protein
VNLQLLIDSIVRQTTVLIAQLATARHVRAPLAHIANQVFLDLAEELSRQGVSRKVSADMFGLALRTYLRKIQRLGEGATERGRSIWQAVLEQLQSGSAMTRGELLAHFRHDEVEIVSGVLHDLTESGLVFRTGVGDRTTYRAATDEELGKMSRISEGEGLDELVWALIYREGPLSKTELGKLTGGTNIDPALARLSAAGHIQEQHTASEPRYEAQQLYVARQAAAGWEAAVFDHFQAMVKTIAARVTDPAASDREQVGGSTYSFEVWHGHPFEAEALGHLKSFREATSELRAKIRQYNQNHERASEVAHITVYGGQHVAFLHGTDNDDV